MTRPQVELRSVGDYLLGAGEASTSVTWSASENGSFILRAGGRGCRSGTEIERGSYTGAPAPRAVTVAASELPEGVTALHLCVTDSAGNVGFDKTRLAKDSRLSSVPPPTSLTLNPEADASVQQANPATNFGAATTLRTEAGADPDVESYLRFNVSGVSGPVQSARLRLFVTDASPDGPALYTASGGWSESQITWANRPPRATTAIGDKGAVTVGSWIEYDLSSVVKGDGSYSFALATGSADATAFHSREGSNKPQLVLSVLPDTEPPTAPSNLTASAPASGPVALAWAHARDNIRVAGYRVYRNGSLLAKLGRVAGYSDGSVLPGTTYSYTLRAADASGNLSARSAPVSVRTPSPSPVVLAAGDIACSPRDGSFNGGQGRTNACRQAATSTLLANRNAAAVLPLGDLQYEGGALADFRASYDLSWGRFKSITRPVPGNHEYGTSGAAGYFDYFNGAGNANGRAGERGKGYYSFDVGGWHLVALNSNCSRVGGCAPGSPQERWLRADLAANPRKCTLAYWHHPRFSSGTTHGDQPSTAPLWQALYDFGAEVVLSGHEHNYERFARQDAAGNVNPGFGIRELVVGTGGKNRYQFGTARPNSEVRNSSAFGVLALTLHSDSYVWRFRSAPGGTLLDSGSESCHGAPPSAAAQPTFPIRAAFYYPWFPEAWSQRGISPYTKYDPTLGLYSSTDQAVRRSHLRSLEYARFEAGIYSWWGQGSKEDQRFPAMLAETAASASPLKWALYHEREGNGPNPTVAELGSDLDHIKARYASDPGYLKVAGRPVIFVYGDATDDCTTADRWEQANTPARGFHVVLKVFPGYSACPSQPEGWHQYAPSRRSDRQAGHSFTISPEFDLTGDEPPRLARDPVAFEQAVAAMVASNEPWQLVTTFNEWGENSATESAAQWASPSGQGVYLDALARR